MEFTAKLYDGSQSKPFPITVILRDEYLHIQPEELAPLSFPMDQCEFEAPLGHTLRVINLPDGGRIETYDFSQYDQFYSSRFRGMGLGWVHHIENHWRWVLGSMLGLIAFVWSFIFFGIPILAHFIAFQVPIALNNSLADGTLTALDKTYLSPSNLEPSEQSKYRDHFEQLYKEFPPEYRYRLVFRSSPAIGANAFALPDGTVILLDELIALADNEEQVLAVLAHELGHVKNRHGLQGVISDAGAFLILSMLLGDVTSISSLGATLPTFLIENNYSRNFEAEADRVSAEWLLKHYDSTDAMESMLIKLHSDHDSDLSIPEILSSHPEIDHRVQMLKQFEADFKTETSS